MKCVSLTCPKIHSKRTPVCLERDMEMLAGFHPVTTGSGLAVLPNIVQQSEHGLYSLLRKGAAEHIPLPFANSGAACDHLTFQGAADNKHLVFGRSDRSSEQSSFSAVQQKTHPPQGPVRPTPLAHGEQVREWTGRGWQRSWPQMEMGMLEGKGKAHRSRKLPGRALALRVQATSEVTSGSGKTA